jgi:hypothetical protein
MPLDNHPFKWSTNLTQGDVDSDDGDEAYDGAFPKPQNQASILLYSYSISAK